MQTPDGKRLRSNVLGLMYHDTATDEAVLIAQLQDSEGELITANQVLYTNAFDGVKADVRYTYRKGGLEQDVILRERPPAPQSYGMNPDTTELEVMTEFVDAPDAQVGNDNGQADEEIGWGATRLGHGKAFDLGMGASSQSQIPVSKKYLNIQGKHILLEKVNAEQIEPVLSKLPLQSSLLRKSAVMLSKDMELPDLPPALTSKKSIKLALSAPQGSGYVMDYSTVNSSVTNYTFQGNITYYISGTVNLYGTTTIEPGTVVKCASGAGSSLVLNGPVDCRTGPYHPAVFTAKDDNTVGETIVGSTGSPSGYYGSGMELSGSYPVHLHDLHVSHASSVVAVGFNVTSNSLKNAQLCNIGYVINAYHAGDWSLRIY